MFHGFMEVLKLPNKKMYDICNCKKKCVRQCVKCKNKMCVECFKNHNKEYINTCAYCRHNLLDHSENRKFMDDIRMY